MADHAVSLGVPDDRIAVVAAGIVGGVVGKGRLLLGDQLVEGGLDVLLRDGHVGGNVVVQLLADIVVDQAFEQRVLSVAHGLQIGDAILADFLVGQVVGGEVIPHAGDVGFKISSGLFGQAGHRLVIELIQPQLRGLRLEHGVLQQRLGNQLLVDGIVAVVGQRDAVVARKLGIDAGVLLENVVQEDHAAIVFDDDLRVIVGLIQLNLRLKLGDALVGGVELRLKVAALLGKGHRAAERERQNEAQNFPDHHVLPPQILFPQRELF